MNTTEKEKLIEEYHNKRDLTVGRVLELGGLDHLKDELSDMLDFKVKEVTTDSRKLKEGQIFFYWGKTHKQIFSFDPIECAKDKKCLLVLTDSEIPMTENVRQVIVKDIDLKESFAAIIRYIRDIHKAKIITVTGSVGKTSTKEMIESVLREHYQKPLISKGNNNSTSAVARNIQALKRPTSVYLQEVGAVQTGTVEFCARQLNPNMAVYTNIGESHIEDYGGVENLIKDKLSLSEFGRDDCINFVNFDDEHLMNYRFKASQKVVTYSLENDKAEYYADHIINFNDGYEFDIVHRTKQLIGYKKERTRAKVNTAGKHNILNAVVAFAVGSALNIPENEIVNGIGNYMPSGIRQNLMVLNGYNVFVDCYNSSLMAVDKILSTIDDMDIDGRKIAVLGDVLKLGSRSETTHREIGKTVLSHDVDEVIFYGKDVEYAYEECLKEISDGNTSLKAYYVTDRNEMETIIRRILSKEDLILFKSSHAVNLGASIDRLFGTDIIESNLMGEGAYRKQIIGDFEYYIFEDHATVRRYLGHDETVEIPETVDAEIEIPVFDIKEVRTIPVDKLGKTSFKGMDHVKTVIAKDNIFVREGAFDGASITLKSKED